MPDNNCHPCGLDKSEMRMCEWAWGSRGCTGTASLVNSLSMQHKDMFLCIFLLSLSGLHLSGATESGIIGGNEAKPHSRPYMVSFRHKKIHMCGGMLIRNDYVLTSAHCLDDYKSLWRKRLDVVLGAHNISKKESSQQRIQVKKYIRHPSYKKKQNDWTYDIMLLKLKTKAKLGNSVNVIALPEKNTEVSANQTCSIAGWGMKVPNEEEASSVLREVTLKVQQNSDCKKTWNDYFKSVCMICTASDGKRAFCKGDSGSPLICNNKPQGIATFSYNDCLNHNFPEVYIKVAYFIPWINKVINSD